MAGGGDGGVVPEHSSTVAHVHCHEDDVLKSFLICSGSLQLSKKLLDSNIKSPVK